jgi:hypothetical protein
MKPKRKAVNKIMNPQHLDWDAFSKKLTSLCPNCFACPHRQHSKQCSDRHARATLRSFSDAVDIPASLIAFQARGVGGCDCRIAQKNSWAKLKLSRRRRMTRKFKSQL